MKKNSIKAYLRAQTISGRSSTISNAFASARAPVESYEEKRVDKALRLLGQDPENLHCIYCKGSAATWDHLVSIVLKSQFRGHGHQLGNLVPSCRTCNEQKGGKDWKVFLREKALGEDLKGREKAVQAHIRKFTKPVKIQPKGNRLLLNEYEKLRSQILAKMKKADGLAKRIRDTF